MYDKRIMRDARQQAIKNIVARRAVATQAELLAALARAGQRVDQSTLSRDLAELGVRKARGRYVLPAGNGHAAAAGAGTPNYAAVVRGFGPCGPHLVVVRTTIGQAQPVSLWLDAQADSSIVATLAGDDTIFVATKTRKTQAVALRRLAAWFGEEKRER